MCYIFVSQYLKGANSPGISLCFRFCRAVLFFGHKSVWLCIGYNCYFLIVIYSKKKKEKSLLEYEII